MQTRLQGHSARLCYYPIPSLHSGLVLLWVLFLLLIISSSALIISKRSLMQWHLMGYYESQFEKQKALRRLDLEITEYLSEQGILNSCVDQSLRYDPCDIVEMPKPGWVLYGRALPEVERASSDSQNIFSTENLDVSMVTSHWVVLELRDSVRHKIISKYVYRIALTASGNSFSVTRKLMWYAS